VKTIDGSAGEGGGQILRTTLSLSAITGQPVSIVNVRAGRAKPGLLRQHLTALHAAAEVCGAAVEGDALGSSAVVFRPGLPRAGRYVFQVGSAGSALLVLQTVLPVLLSADGPSEVTVEGGTHNDHAPPYDFIAQAFLPLLHRMGAGASAELARPGFYPAGGGAVTLRLAPPAGGLGPLELMTRGPLAHQRCRALVAHLPYDVGRRELAAFSRRVTWPTEGLEVVPAPGALGPGNALMAELRYAHVTELFTAFGARGVRSEAVGRALADQVRAYLRHDAPVGEHLADQLLLPLAIGAGGVFRTGPLSLHARTNIEVIQQLLEVSVEVRGAADGTATVAVRRA
jgi:RNA 3'-terminal phosphate cyclase (ATP)